MTTKLERELAALRKFHDEFNARDLPLYAAFVPRQAKVAILSRAFSKLLDDYYANRIDAAELEDRSEGLEEIEIYVTAQEVGRKDKVIKFLVTIQQDSVKMQAKTLRPFERILEMQEMVGLIAQREMQDMEN